MPTFLFPGQGSQKSGVAAAFCDASPAAREIFKQIRPLLPANVFAMMMHGEQDLLNDTRNAQPALLCLEIALVAHLDALAIRPEQCAGHSLGEISALTVAGVLALEAAVPLVLERARLMSENVPEGGMAAVLGMNAEAIESLLPEDVQVANYNGAAQTIISGTLAALATATEILKAAGAKRILPLPVSGPFHSKFMGEASDKLEQFLQQIPFSPPRIPFISSVSGTYETDPGRIRQLLAEQLVKPVRWTDVMRLLAGKTAVETGPGTVLAGLAKRADEAPVVYAADSLEACSTLAAALER